MRYNEVYVYRDHLSYMKNRRVMSHIQRQCRKGDYERTTRSTKRKLKAFGKCVQFKAASGSAVGGVKTNKCMKMNSSQEKADSPRGILL